MFAQTGEREAWSGAAWEKLPYRRPLILTACPASGALVPTGVDVEMFGDLAPDNTLLACPDCGEDHDWTPSEAVLVPSAVLPPRKTGRLSPVRARERQ